jgi:hypothetical protein
MNYLLFGGSQNVGKSEAIWRVAQFLMSRGFFGIDGSIPTSPLSVPKPQPFPDFIIVLQGVDKYGNIIKILLNSATDTPYHIDMLKQFINTLSYTVDIIISSIRDDFWPRPYFFMEMKINKKVDFELEIPLAKITRRDVNFWIALNWYQQQIDELAIHSLSNPPFNI